MTLTKENCPHVEVSRGEQIKPGKKQPQSGEKRAPSGAPSAIAAIKPTPVMEMPAARAP